jgi:hypothetical protein
MAHVGEEPGLGCVQFFELFGLFPDEDVLGGQFPPAYSLKVEADEKAQGQEEHEGGDNQRIAQLGIFSIPMPVPRFYFLQPGGPFPVGGSNSRR